jgi:hypothetical protein
LEIKKMKYHEETVTVERIEKVMRDVGVDYLTQKEEEEFKSLVREELGSFATDVEVKVAVKRLQSAWLNESETHPGDFDRRVHEIIDKVHMDGDVEGEMAHGGWEDFEEEVNNKLEDDATDEEIEKAVREVEEEWKKRNNDPDYRPGEEDGPYGYII